MSSISTPAGKNPSSSTEKFISRIGAAGVPPGKKPPTGGADLTMRDHAVAHARRGFRVFKLQVNGKKPAVEKFYDVASADPGAVFQMWTDPVTGESLHNNIGVLTGDGLIVIDVDVKDGKQGRESLAMLVEDMGLDTNTYRVRTPSGGPHLYYRTSDRSRTVRAKSATGWMSAATTDTSSARDPWWPPAYTRQRMNTI